MALEAAFGELAVQFRILREALRAVHTTIIEDRPLRDDVALVDSFGDAVEDILGRLEEALIASREGQQAVGHPLDLDRMRRALTTCQERFNWISQRFFSDLVSYQRLDDLTALGRERRGEWIAWGSSVKEGLDRCQQPLYDANQALFRCWQEIAERVGMTSVSVQATNIGQQITTLEGREVAREGIT